MRNLKIHESMGPDKVHPESWGNWQI